MIQFRAPPQQDISHAILNAELGIYFWIIPKLEFMAGKFIRIGGHLDVNGRYIFGKHVIPVHYVKDGIGGCQRAAAAWVFFEYGILAVKPFSQLTNYRF